jgi:hypothetical protein
MNTEWVWKGMVYWINPKFSNYLKERWHHYRFCRGRSEVYTHQVYLAKWEKDLHKLIGKREGDQVHMYGHYILLEMLNETPPSKKLIEFLESEDRTKAIDDLIWELNHYQSQETRDQENLKIITAENNSIDLLAEKKDMSAQVSQEKSPNSDLKFASSKQKIAARAYVMGADIYHELSGTEKEYEELKASGAKYVEFLKQQFRVEMLPGSIKKLRNFDYRAILKSDYEPSKGQLYPHLKQIAQNPSIFGEKVSQYVKNILEKHFENQRNNELRKKG